MPSRAWGPLFMDRPSCFTELENAIQDISFFFIPRPSGGPQVFCFSILLVVGGGLHVGEGLLVPRLSVVRMCRPVR